MFVIMLRVDYEGESEAYRCDTEEELLTWFKEENHREYSLDDLSIYRDDAPDVYELAARAGRDDRLTL